MSRSENIFDLQEKIIPLEKELMALKNNPKEQVVFEYFDFSTWLQSKIKRKPFLTLKREEMALSN